jgi:hypothetical protein
MQRFIYVSLWIVLVAALAIVSKSEGAYCGYGSQQKREGVEVGSFLSFMSSDVVRGRRKGGRVVIPMLSVLVESFESSLALYCNVGGIFDLGDKPRDVGDVSFGCGVVGRTNDGFVFDVGGMIFRVSSKQSSLLKDVFGVKVLPYETYVGIVIDNIFRPSLYCFYNFYSREIALEGKVKYDWSLASLGLYNFMFGFTGEIGYDSSDRPLGFPYSDFFGRKDYVYYGVALRLIYRLRSKLDARVGVSYEGNAASKNSWVNRGEKRYKDNIWFNASFNFAF